VTGLFARCSVAGEGVVAAIAAALGLLPFQLRGGLHPGTLEQDGSSLPGLPVGVGQWAARGRSWSSTPTGVRCAGRCGTAMESDRKPEHRGAVDLVLLDVEQPPLEP